MNVNTCSSNTKCNNNKNLGIVVECVENADENQALLLNSSQIKRKSSDRLMEGNKTIRNNQTMASESTKNDIEEQSNIKHKKKSQHQPSRFERGRLGLITFLNNITASPTSSDLDNTSEELFRKNNRSQSITSTANSHQIKLPEYKNINKSTKSLSGKLTVAENRRGSHCDVQQEALSVGDVPLTGKMENSISNDFKENGTTEMDNSTLNNQNSAPSDKLSIKSGVSMAASSNSGPSESLFSAGSAQSNSSGIKSCIKQKECPICCLKQSTQNFYRLKACTHIFCKTCLVKYVSVEIAESRTDISCPECPVFLQISDIYNLLSHQPEMLERFEFYSLRRVLSIDPDTRWCPAPDCTHCKSYWHPNQTCDQARSRSFFNSPLVQSLRSSLPANNVESTRSGGFVISGDEMKACPRCGALITKMQCALCNAEFCWLCLKQINELHYLSPTGCTFWGKKPWTRKKKLLWQIGTLIGAPLGIALIAGLAVPGIICGVPIFIGRKTYQRFSNLSRTKRQLATALSVFCSLVISPVLAVMTVGVGVPIMLAYVYGVVPLSLCRNGACGGATSTNEGNGGSTFRDEEGAYGERIVLTDGLVSLTDKPNTEDASIQAIAGSQYNYDSRSVHTIWSSGQYGGHAGVIESVHGVNINGEDAENASTMACCSASIAAQASERRSLTGSNSSFKTRPRSSISNSRGVSEEPGKMPAKFTRKVSAKNVDGSSGVKESISVDERIRQDVLPASSSHPGPSHITCDISTDDLEEKKKSRFSFRSFIRHPINTVMGKRKSFNAVDAKE
uniref:RBR-type E3 ubiquitin transferase n=1 Tax=Meloidogyne hapla TaxID=6305 RepID=A0A1I8BRC8_MELHA